MHTKLTLSSLAVGALLAGLTLGGTAMAHEDAPADRQTTQQTQNTQQTQQTHAAESTDAKQDRVSVQRERGLVIEAVSDDAALPAFVTIYENDVYGNSIQVVLDPENDLIGAAEGTAPFVVDGVIDVTVQIAGKPARLTGTVVETDTTRNVEPVQDAGEQLVIRGTHRLLDADLTLSYDGASVPLQAAPAFAYDNETRKVTLYGN